MKKRFFQSEAPRFQIAVFSLNKASTPVLKASKHRLFLAWLRFAYRETITLTMESKFKDLSLFKSEPLFDELKGQLNEQELFLALDQGGYDVNILRRKAFVLTLKQWLKGKYSFL